MPYTNYLTLCSRSLKDRVQAEGVLVCSSGAMEKNIDIIVGRRFKKQGMNWIKEGANNLLKLRILCYDRSDWEFCERQKLTAVSSSPNEITQPMFRSYGEALACVEEQEKGNWWIVGASPFERPAPLEAVQHYRLVYESPVIAQESEGETLPEIRIFEHIR